MLIIPHIDKKMFNLNRSQQQKKKLHWYVLKEAIQKEYFPNLYLCMYVNSFFLIQQTNIFFFFYFKVEIKK